MSGRKSSGEAQKESQPSDGLRTWVELDADAARHNVGVFRRLVGSRVKLWAVVKSNAYGHGIVVFSKLLDRFGVDGFCVDSIVEGLRLREEGIKKFILVLGPTLTNRLAEAAGKDVAITISNFEALKALTSFVAKKATRGGSASRFRSQRCPEFHLKFDTGMHRQGFYREDAPRVVKLLRSQLSILNSRLTGLYTHFASAKDLNYPTYTERQFGEFVRVVKVFERAGFRNLTKHCAATAATLTGRKYLLDAVRVGMGLYGYFPSRELELQLPQVRLEPVLGWKTVVTEVKRLRPGDYVGYDLTERVTRPTTMAILPVGYWHGFPRALSLVGEAVVCGRRARVLGRVSMDLLAVDVTGIPAAVGDDAVLLGKSGKEFLRADEVAQKAGTTHYEFLTRLNPLMERVVVDGK